MKVPKTIDRLIESFQSLPGIGPKSAQRITFHLLHFPQEHLDRFARALTDLKSSTKLCVICKNVGEDEVCNICNDYSRERNKIMVVANPMDAFAIESSGYKGLYHVLHGVIDPLNGIGPEELFIDELLARLQGDEISMPVEVILATNSSMEGESTAMYIAHLIEDNGITGSQCRISRIARGLPVGGDIEYADQMTLSRAIEGRVEYSLHYK